MTVRIGIIGAGLYCATTHVPALQAMPGVEVVATCRTRPDKLRAFNEHFGIPHGYTDYRDLLARHDLDGVIVASTHRWHYTHAAAVLERGLPLLLEKPITVALKDAQALREMGRKAGVPIVVGYNRQYWHTFDTASAILSRGTIGEIVAVQAVWRSNLIWALQERQYPESQRALAFWQPGDPPNFRCSEEEAGGGAMADAGAHLCHAVMFLSRLWPREVSAWSDTAGCGIDVNWSVSVRFDNGALGNLALLGLCPDSKHHEVLLSGTEGLIRVDDEATECAVRGHTLERVPKAYQRSVAENFVQAIRGEAQPVCTLDDGYRAQVLLCACLESARTGVPVLVER